MILMKWIFFDLGATLVDESDVYASRCEFAIKQLNIDPAEFMNTVYEKARISPTPIRTAAKSYGVDLPEWDNPQILDSYDPETGAFTTHPAKTKLTVRHFITHTSGLCIDGFYDDIAEKMGVPIKRG